MLVTANKAQLCEVPQPIKTTATKPKMEGRVIVLFTQEEMVYIYTVTNG